MEDRPPPAEADTRTFSTFSPAANIGNGLDAVWTENVALACTIIGPTKSIDGDTVAVEDARVPLNVPVLVYFCELCCGIADTVTEDPGGMFVADIATGMGFVVPAGSVISGLA